MDTAILEAMRMGSLSQTSGVKERFVVRAREAMDERLRTAHARFDRQSESAHGDRVLFTKAMLALRKEYYFLVQVAGCMPLSAEGRAAFADMVVQHRDQAQVSLEKSAEADRTGKLLSLVRNNPVNRV